jgi:flagellar biosynthesis protein FlhF
MRDKARELIARYRVKTPSTETPIANLSGGNVQRAVLARELSGDVDVLIVANPCFGLDFASVAEIRAQIMEQRNRGAAVLLVSEDLDEILELADRVASSSAEAATPAPAPRVPAPAPAAKPARAEANPGAKPAAPRKAATAAPVAPVTAIAAPAPKASEGLVDELHAMKTLIEDRFNTLTWLGQARQNPIQSNLMLKLIRSGYSPTLARTILERMPEDVGAAESLRWVMAVLERNLKTDARSRPLIQEGGTYALVGATGVGKTTTAAKLAGLCARAHGPASVGLITQDTYRVGGHDQLRAFGRMLGVVAHLAHDQAALQDLQIA